MIDAKNKNFHFFIWILVAEQEIHGLNYWGFMVLLFIMDVFVVFRGR